MICPNCGADVPAHVRDCVECEEPVGYPNVRAAEAKDEREALHRRRDEAFVSARAGAYEEDLVDFGLAAGSSVAVIARSLAMLDALVQSDNVLMQSYHQLVRAGSRVPEDNAWDRGRVAAESTISPNYHDHIQYAALSIDGKGVQWFGSFHITLKDSHIAKRTTVFEENVFAFCDHKNVIAGKPPPFGYRAPWDSRGELAQAKLFFRLRKGIANEEFAGILLDQGTDSKNSDFIEAHIYGGIHARSIECVRVFETPSGADRHIWRQVKRRLSSLGVRVIEE